MLSGLLKREWEQKKTARDPLFLPREGTGEFVRKNIEKLCAGTSCNIVLSYMAIGY